MTKVQKISAQQARTEFSEIINQAAYTSTRTIVTRHGKDAAAIIPIPDLERLQKEDDALDDFGELLKARCP